MLNSPRKHKKAKRPHAHAKRKRNALVIVRSRSGHAAKRANPKRRRRASNPLLRVHRHGKRRRNPSLGAFGDLGGLAMEALVLGGGGITARSVPQIVAPGSNTGLLGYGMNLLTAVGTSMLISKFKGGRFARPWLLGGVAFTLYRAIDDYFGQKLLTFAQFNPTATPMLSGDVACGVGLAGVFRNLDYVIPSPGRPALPPAPPMVATTAAAKTLAGRKPSWNQSFN